MKTHQRLAAIIAILAAPGLGAGQTIQKASVNAAPATNTGGCGSDKLQLTGFTVSPTTPVANQTATVTLTLKNLCTGASLNIPYKVTDQAVQVATGTKTVAANSSATVQVPLTFAPGSHALDAMLDANNTLNESVANRTNNNASNGIGFTVAAPNVTLIMHPEMLPASFRSPKVEVVHHECGAGVVFSELAPKFVVEHSKIPAPPAPFVPAPFPNVIRPTGLFLCKVKVEVEMYALQLKNGWKVKSADVQSSGSGGNWSWISRPAPGSTNATTKLQLTALPGTPTLAVKLNVEIEGPQGTNPFQ